MNHILANYRNSYSRNYAPYHSSSNGIIKRIKSNVVGQPTGFTQSIMDLPFGSGFINGGLGNPYGQGYAQDFATNKGYGFINSLPAMTRSGITILD